MSSSETDAKSAALAGGGRDGDTGGSRSRSRPRTGGSLRTRFALGFVVCLAIGLTLGPAVGVAGADIGAPASTGPAATGTPAESTIVVSNDTVAPNGTGTHRIELTEVPKGLAGYQVTLAFADDGVATVSNASYPAQYGMTTDPVVTADGRTVTLEAVDLNDDIAPGATNVTLAHVTVTATAAGETDLRVTAVQADADDGSRVDPSLEAGSLTVAGNGSSAAESAGTNGGPSANESATPSDSVPGFAVGSALAALATIAVALLARSR
ncbi:hypothetical protein [Natrinema sp. 74]|uniref:hypothetical protein n=1 Tax=Natrinema sp. 74 TaxID=3384159 RepID=UPI0038D48557